MYVAAGELAARVAGSPWEELVTERVFRPLGMERTVPTTTAAQASSNVAQPHARVDGEVVEIENEILDAVAPAGAVWSSVSEMARWLRMLLAEGEIGEGGEAARLLEEDVATEILKPQTLLDLTSQYPYVAWLCPHWTTYGLGFFQLDYRGRAVSFHTGSIDGMAAIVGLVPDEELGIVALANLDHAEVRHALLWRAIDLLLGVENGRDWSAELLELYGERAREDEERRAQAEADRREGTSPSLPLERYAGTYAHEINGLVEVTVAPGAGGEQLRLVVAPRLAADLTHWHYDTFEARFDRRWQGEMLVTFHLDTAARPTRLEIGGAAYGRVETED